MFWLVLSYVVLAYQTLDTCPVLSCSVLSCPVLSCPVCVPNAPLPNNFLSTHALFVGKPSVKFVSNSLPIVLCRSDLMCQLIQANHGREENLRLTTSIDTSMEDLPAELTNGYPLKTSRQDHHPLQACLQEVAGFSIRLFLC
ncbi:hypothetical protein OSB04_016190 [Centaurea solstitialis]|uniref:Uncharacterized protein n=1 Tax=Centaurea solstitialis TaxID=347529 RepID=A0AA38TCC7_9ASTR|nr:hypothetical protein OSB04_016190 [Centaurea solstitialis]